MAVDNPSLGSVQVAPVKKKAAWRRRGKERARVGEGSTVEGEQSAAPKQALIVVVAPDGDAACGHDSGWGSCEGITRRQERVLPFSAL